MFWLQGGTVLEKNHFNFGGQEEESTPGGKRFLFKSSLLFSLLLMLMLMLLMLLIWLMLLRLLILFMFFVVADINVVVVNINVNAVDGVAVSLS